MGKHLTIKLLAGNFYSKIKILVRKPLDIEHQNLEQIIINFNNVADDVFCCLGTTMKKADSKPAFYKVNFTYPLAIAKAALAKPIDPRWTLSEVNKAIVQNSLKT